MTMDLVWHFLDEWRLWARWLAALACFGISYYAARQVADRERLFSALALFAVGWVLLMAAMESREQTPKNITLPDRASDVADFLFLLAGVLLFREAPINHWLWSKPGRRVQRWIQIGGLLVLLFLVVPSRIPLPIEFLKLFTPEQHELVLGQLLGIFATVSLFLGALAISTPSQSWRWLLLPFGIFLAIDTYLDVWRTIELLPIPKEVERPQWELWRVYLTIPCWLLVTGLFCYVVLRHAGCSANPPPAKSSAT